MSGTEDDDHSSPIKTPKQLLTVVTAAFVFPVLIIWLLGKFITGDPPIDPNNRAFSEEAVAERLRPVGKLVMAGDSTESDVQAEGGPDQAAVAAAAPAAAPMADGGDPAEKAKAIYTASCAACHMTGAAGAPKLGDNAAWAPRIKAGSEALYDSAIKGKNAMPPKGGNASLSDADVKAAVDYMVSQSK